MVFNVDNPATDAFHSIAMLVKSIVQDPKNNNSAPFINHCCLQSTAERCNHLGSDIPFTVARVPNLVYLAPNNTEGIVAWPSMQFINMSIL